MDLLDGAKRVADAIKDLLSATRDLSDNPNDPLLQERFSLAQQALHSAVNYMEGASKGVLADEASKKLLIESSKAVAAALQDLLNLAKNRSSQTNDPNVKTDIANASKKAGEAVKKLVNEVTTLAPVILNEEIRKQIQESAQTLETASNYLLKSLQFDDEDDPSLAMAAKAVSDAIAQLLASTKIAEPKTTGPDFASAAKLILDETARLMANMDDPSKINESSKLIVSASTKLVGAAKSVAETSDEATRERLLKCAKAVAEATRRLVGAATTAATKSTPDAQKALQEACQRLAEATQVNTALPTLIISGTRW